MEIRRVVQEESCVFVSGMTYVMGNFIPNYTILCSAIKSPNVEVYFGMANKKILAYFGFTSLRAGVAEAWILPTFHERTFADELAIAKSARTIIMDVLENQPSRQTFRLEMAVGDKDRKWAEFLGFKFSHICVRYDGKNDQYMYYREASWLEQRQQAKQ